MANPEHLQILSQGLDVWNQWREKNPKITPNLEGADLNGRKLDYFVLSGSNLKQAQLRETSLSGASLNDASLYNADLLMANFTFARLNKADLRYTASNNAVFSHADLTGADLSGSDLTCVNFTWAQLNGTNFSDAQMGGSNFGDNDLSVAIGLDTVRHLGPSAIGIHTLIRSHNRIPITFLQGVGVPDNFITYLNSLSTGCAE